MGDEIKIEVGQVWRKLGPYDWLKVDMIHDPRYTGYDGGLIGCSVTFFPPQKKKIVLRDGKKRFIPGHDWEEQVKENRFLLEHGQPANML
jgi:hypothetical protein